MGKQRKGSDEPAAPVNAKGALSPEMREAANGYLDINPCVRAARMDRSAEILDAFARSSC